MTDGNSVEDLKCIWMRAGLVAYKLCDRDFDCENCMLDRALRGEKPEVERKSARRPKFPDNFRETSINCRFIRCTLSPNVFYDPRHTWAKVEDQGVVRIGLDDLAQQMTGPIYSVGLPGLGGALSREHSCALRSAAGKFRFAIPVAGKVCWTNDGLRKRPTLINAEPYGNGAILAVEPFALSQDLRKLHYGRRAMAFMTAEVNRLSDLLETHLLETSIGATLLDGGDLAVPLYELFQRSELRKIRSDLLAGVFGEESSTAGLETKEGD